MADTDTGAKGKDAAAPAPEAKSDRQGVPAEKQPPKPASGETDSNMHEQLLRLAAEFDNYKKRTKLDLDSAKRVGRAELVKGLLPILDEFELALIAASKAEDKVLAKGIEMLYSNLMDTLKREGLSEVQADGAFDPYKHEIMMVRESDKRDGTILEVIKKGYMMGGILLRPASVITSKPAPNGQQKR